MKKRIVGSILAIMLLGLTACGDVNQAVIVNNANEEVSVENDVEVSEESEMENTEADAEDTTEDNVIEDNKETSNVSDVTLTGEFKEFSTIDIYGNEITEDLIKGYDLVMVNIWGTFCPPCIDEMPDLGVLAGELKEKNVLLIGVVIDVRVEDEVGTETAIEIAEDTGADYPHLLLSEDLINIYMGNVQAVPETIFLDSTGTIIGSEIGSRSKADWEAVLEGYLD